MRVVAATLALLLAACGSAPPAPDWQLQAQSALQRAASAYLAGDSRIGALEFERARAAVARTGRADLLARVELTRCAAQVASLEPAACAGFEALRDDAGVAERAYAGYLAGRLAPEDIALLPEAQRALAGRTARAHPARAEEVAAETAPVETSAGLRDASDIDALRAIADPLSRLVAAGVLFNADRAASGVAAVAVETASAQGWRRPLLAWLQLQRRQAEAAGTTDEAERLQRRIGLILDAPAAR
jgi:hypothetical protein